MSKPYPLSRLVAFSGSTCIAAGMPEQVVPQLKRFLDADPARPLLILDAVTSRVVELDLRGTADSILAGQFLSAGTDATAAQTDDQSGEASPRRGRGRPRLGVVSREITLLPRHWAWLNTQPGGASVVLRRLVDDARKGSQPADQRRLAQDAAYRFFTVMAGNEPGYEDAIRALYAGDLGRLEKLVAAWPGDIASHALVLAESALGAKSQSLAGGAPA